MKICTDLSERNNYPFGNLYVITGLRVGLFLLLTFTTAVHVGASELLPLTLFGLIPENVRKCGQLLLFSSCKTHLSLSVSQTQKIVL